MKFQLPKNANEVTEGILMDENWYILTLVETPEELVPNRAMKDSDGADPKSGYNVVLKLKVESDNEAYNGRFLTKYLPWPTENDEGKYHALTGQSMVDWKLSGIVSWYKALNGIGSDEVVDTTEVEFLEGQQVQAFVAQEKSMGGDQLTNAISMNHAPLPAEPKGKGDKKK